MMTAQDIRDKRFEKAAWGYRPEDIDEFLGQLEATFQEIDNERADNNKKIQILADKVREYMKDEEALKDALLGAQKQGHQVVAEANEKAAQILDKAKEEAAVLLDEATRQHEIAMEKNRAEIAKEKEALVQARKMVADFKRSLFDMYKSHLEMISAMPEADETEEEEAPAPAPAAPAAKPAEESVTADENKPDPFATSQFSTRVIRGAYESRFSDLQFGDNNGQGTKDSAEA
ncbi:MAG: DivIVA domain-containing protein [Oscillospiraceae bacterium]|nr:DivIVA domain-containing protein [Oscillospiraceae bacterium]